MITITMSNDKSELYIKANYLYKDRIKKAAGDFATFDYNSKYWIVPRAILPRLKNEFDGEIYYKTPLWKIEGKEKPKKTLPVLYSGNKIKLSELKYPLFDYQKFGAKFMIDRLEKYNFCLNADVMGLGKTIQTIEVMKWYFDNKNMTNFIIICKKTLKTQWFRQTLKFSDLGNSLPIFITGNTPKKRQKAYNDMYAAGKGILITNYNNFLNDSEHIKKIPFGIVAIDEVHRIKGHEGRMNNNIEYVAKGKKVIFLTGTPIMSKPNDIYGIIHIAAGDRVFGSYQDFEDRYLVIDQGIYGRQIIGAKNLDELHDKINDFMIRRTEDDIDIELPVITMQQRYCKMDSTQKKIISVLDEKQGRLNALKEKCMISRHEVDPTRMEEFRKILDVEKGFLPAKQFVSDDPRIFDMRKGVISKQLAKLIPNNYQMSDKTESTLDILEDILDNDEKCIIFTRYRTAAVLLKREIEKRFKGYPCLMYTGAENQETRDKNVQLFTNNIGYQILVATEAGNEGLDLQVAAYLINYEQPDNYALKMQRAGRIRRINSVYKRVFVYDMITDDESLKVISKDLQQLDKIERDKDTSESLMN